MSTLTTYPELEQGSDAWMAARCGLLTASTIGALITPTLKVANNETSRGLIHGLAAERITGMVEPTYINADMQRGNDEEPRARDYYADHRATQPVTELGFMVREGAGYKVGYSPDGLVGADGLIEIKAPRQKKHLTTFINGQVPAEHMAQVQTGLWVSGRDWCDFISWYGGMPMFVKTVHADPTWHAVIEQAAIEAEQRITDAIATYTACTEGMEPTEPRPTFDAESITF